MDGGRASESIVHRIDWPQQIQAHELMPRSPPKLYVRRGYIGNRNQNQNNNNNQNQIQNNYNQNQNQNQNQNNVQNHHHDGLWQRTYYFSTNQHAGDRGNGHITLDAASPVTSIDAVYSTGERGYSKRGNDNNDNSGRWRAVELLGSVSQAGLSGLAPTSWIKDDKVGRTVYFVQGGCLEEWTLDESVDDGDWDDGDYAGVELHDTPGEMSVVSWIDDKGM
ncbi:hypothetical protein FRC01_010193 [Tulasnella sp. 417]|nr:hypothetical protein FRC01_010193 [Tulasnella sp. 417]